MLLSNALQFWAGYLTSLLWYLAPFFSAAVMLVLYLHRRSKRKPASSLQVPNHQHKKGNNDVPAPPGSAEDRKRLWKRSRLDLLLVKAKGMALKKEIRSVTDQSAATQLSNQEYMENINEKIATYEAQVLALQNKIDMLETAPAPSAGEAHYLREMIGDRDREIESLRSRLQQMETAKGHEANQEKDIPATERINELEKENAGLRHQLTEQAFLHDMAEEHKLQIAFLNNQLEQRVRAVKQLEYQIETAAAENNRLSDELLLAGNRMREYSEVQQLMEAEAGDYKDRVNALQQELELLQDKLRLQEERMTHYRNLLQKFYHELETAVHTGADAERFTTA